MLSSVGMRGEAGPAWRAERSRGWPRAIVGLHAVVAVWALMTADAASAAMSGSLTTSMGVFAAITALLVLKGWFGLVAEGAVPTAAAVVVTLAGAALLWNVRRGAFRRTLALPSMAPRPARPLVSPTSTQLPAGWNHGELLAAARRHFMQMQVAWDAGDVNAMRELATPHMVDELCSQLPERGLSPNRTDVLSLHAELLSFEELPSAYLLSVEFSGTVREASHADAVAFRELWMLARSKKEASAWQLARQQALL